MKAHILFVILGIPFMQGYLIERRIDHNSWNTLPDHITIPDSICILRNILRGLKPCTTMNAKSIGNCTCKCKDSSHTFFLLNGKWNCVDNEQVRQITGCTTKVTSTNEIGSEIFTVPTSPNLTIEYIASIPGFDPRKCGFYRPSSYMLCNGSWARWPGVNIFNMAGSVNATITPSPNIGLSHYGQVLRLVVDCYFTSWQDPDESFCILFKVEGKRNCSRTTESSTASPVTTLSVTTSVPASPSTSVPSTKSLPGPTTTQYSTIETTTNRVRTIPSTANPRSSSAPRYILKTTTISPLIKKTSNPPTTDSRSALIAGATVAALISILIIIVIVVVILGIRRRKSRRSSTTADGTGNEGYTSNGTVSFQLSPKGDEEYSYAYHDAPIQKPNAVKDSVSNRLYDETENIKGNNTDINKSEPFYNTLEGPEYAKPNISNRVYDETENIKGNKTDINKSEPFYNTLEGPNYAKPNISKDEHLYNTLEEPIPGSPNEPEYHILETQHYMPLQNSVPRVYGTLVRPSNKEGTGDGTQLQSNT